MSIMAELRLVSPRVLEILRKDPTLTEAVLRTGLPTLPGFDGLPIPASVAKVLASLPAEERARREKQMSEQMAAFRSSPQGAALASMVDGIEEDFEEERAELERLGVTADDIGDPLALDKAWHGLHFLLTGSATDTTLPLGAAILGGQEVGEDLGYGPARYLSPAEVSTVADALGQLTHEDLGARFDPSAMEGEKVYPGQWSEPDNEEWLLEAFDDVKAYYTAARDRGYGMLLSMG